MKDLVSMFFKVFILAFRRWFSMIPGELLGPAVAPEDNLCSSAGFCSMDDGAGYGGCNLFEQLQQRLRGIAIAVVSVMLVFCFGTERLNGQVSGNRSNATDEDVCSFLDAHLANVNAIRCGDVLVRTRRVIDSVNVGEFPNVAGMIQEETVLQRLSFDYDSNHYCILESKKMVITDLGSAPASENQPAEGFAGRAFLTSANDDVIYRKHFPVQQEGIAEVTSRDFERVFKGGITEALEIPDFRAFGLATVFVHGGLDMKAKSMSRFRSGDLLVSKSLPGNNRVELVFDTNKISPNANAESLPGRMILVFDTKRLVIVKKKTEVLVGNNWKSAFSSVFEWGEKDGIQIPKRGSSNSNKLLRRPDGREEVGIQDTNVEFYWYSVNEKLQDSLFDKSRFATLIEFNRQFDTSVLDVVGKRDE